MEWSHEGKTKVAVNGHYPWLLEYHRLLVFKNSYLYFPITHSEHYGV